MTANLELPNEFTDELVSLVASDRGGRGVSKLCTGGHWLRASAILSSLRRVAIVSGFFVPKAGAPETDGPGGALLLARAFYEEGRESEVWTDSLCVEAFKECAKSIGFPTQLVKVPDVNVVLDEYKPDGIVFTERLGRASDGKYYNIRKKDISEWTTPLDELALKAAKSGIATVGIGDGGNEVGMGNFYNELSFLLPDYKNCLSVIDVDAALPVDVSNWGAYALVASLSQLWHNWRGHRGDDERNMLCALKACGVVDGISCKPESSVDGFPMDIQISITNQLYRLWKNFT